MCIAGWPPWLAALARHKPMHDLGSGAACKSPISRLQTHHLTRCGAQQVHSARNQTRPASDRAERSTPKARRSQKRLNLCLQFSGMQCTQLDALAIARHETEVTSLGAKAAAGKARALKLVMRF